MFKTTSSDPPVRPTPVTLTSARVTTGSRNACFPRVLQPATTNAATAVAYKVRRMGSPLVAGWWLGIGGWWLVVGGWWDSDLPALRAGHPYSPATSHQPPATVFESRVFRLFSQL